MINSVDEISRMTLAGENTVIQVNNLVEAKNMLLLCQKEIKLNILSVDFVDMDYDELKNICLQIIKLKNLKVCFIILPFYY